MCRSIDAQPRELPLPEVNSRSLTKGPGLLHADAGGTKACAAPQGPDAATINASNTLSGKHVTTPELTPAQASGADVDSEMRDAADCDVGLTDGRDHEGPGQESNDQRDEDTVMETHQDECSSQNRIWPLSLPDTLTDEQGCESMKWLREWLAYGQSSVRDTNIMPSEPVCMPFLVIVRCKCFPAPCSVVHLVISFNFGFSTGCSRCDI